MRKIVAIVALSLAALFVAPVVATDSVPVVGAQSAKASTSAPCYAMGHHDTYWTSHGVRHWADYWYHGTFLDQYHVYHVYAGAPYTVYVGEAYCWGAH